MVLIANAAKFHPLHAKAAIEAGKHVFVEKPHGIDPYGMKLLEQACNLAREKKLSVVSGLHTAITKATRKLSDASMMAKLATSLPSRKLSAPPYGITERKPGMSELEWQCSTQYHFTWLSGDDVHAIARANLDRSRWVLHERCRSNATASAGVRR
jgi:hypothetical protein